MKLQWKNLDEAEHYIELMGKKRLPNLSKVLNEDRVRSWAITAGGGLEYFYGASLMTEESIGSLQALADEQQLIEKYSILLSGERINTGENRRVLHHLTRGELRGSIVDNGQNIGQFYQEQNLRIKKFCEKVFSGKITGSTGKKFDTAVQIGIGGSDLGPRALHIALSGICSSRLEARFVSNVDPDDAARIIALINPETTLFILVSKSGLTQETLANRDILLKRMQEQGIPGFDASRHLVAVTSRTSPLAESDSVLDSFYIDDNIGGRYSSTSAVGGVILSLSFGSDVFEQILAGAHDADKAAEKKDIRKNAALMDAMIGIYYRNVLNLPTVAVLPYSQALSRFPAHLQQLDMESNGKSVNRYGQAISYPTGPIVFGEPGTNGQHSFYQLLHQGTDIVPLQFIGFRESQCGGDVVMDGSTSQSKLNANLAAQIIAFAKGRKHKNANKSFDGMRPSSLLVADKLTPKTLGALLAHYENKVMFQGFCWNINSFDQEGVQLGKILASSVLDSSTEDEALKTYARILGLQSLFISMG